MKKIIAMYGDVGYIISDFFRWYNWFSKSNLPTLTYLETETLIYSSLWSFLYVTLTKSQPKLGFGS